jgi:predicted nucleotidyltransferase
MNEQQLQQIRKNLQVRESARRHQRELLRLERLQEVENLLKRYFSDFPATKVYLFGSILVPGHFTPDSDIDIAVENHPHDRLDLYSALSRLLPYPVDVVIMEQCHFASEIRENGRLLKTI